jgi:hypothetical protein
MTTTIGGFYEKDFVAWIVKLMEIMPNDRVVDIVADGETS